MGCVLVVGGGGGVCTGVGVVGCVREWVVCVCVREWVVGGCVRE